MLLLQQMQNVLQQMQNELLCHRLPENVRVFIKKNLTL